jgi:Zn-finger nucleic acid-binding protein
MEIKGTAAAAVLNVVVKNTKGKTYLRDDNTTKIELSKKYESIISHIEKELSKEEQFSSERICPECGKNFIKIGLNDIEIEFCHYCSSFWFDTGELKSIADIQNENPDRNLKFRLSKFKCPVCNKSMEEHLFTRRNNLLVDICPFHGIYLQSGELVRFMNIADNELL